MRKINSINDTKETCGIEIAEDLKKRKIQWYDLVKCKYSYSNNNATIYLPAAFLKIKGKLPSDINLGDERQYILDFCKFKKDEKTIDELFEEALIKEKIPSMNNMSKFCKHLYKKSENLDDYGKVVDNSERQFRNEFQNWLKEEFYDGIELPKYDEFDSYYLRDLLKLFILFKSVKIINVENPLDCARGYLPEEANVINIEKIISLKKDNLSIAPLDGGEGSRNQIYIMKLYALLWTNFNMNQSDFNFICNYIIFWEQTSWEIVDWDLGVLLRNIDKIYCVEGNNLMVSDVFLNKNDLMKDVDRRIKSIFKYKTNTIENYFADRKPDKISIFVYYILKRYIINKMKYHNLKVLANEESKALGNIYIDRDKFIEINQKTKEIRLERCSDFLKLLKANTKPLEDEEQNFILDFIFPNSKNNKEQKRNILKNNFYKIELIYKTYFIRQYLYGFPRGDNIFYCIIISSRIFNEIKHLSLKNLKYTLFNKQSNIDDRRKNINSLYKQITKGGLENISIEKFAEVMVYLKVIGFILGRYDCLFNLKSQDDIDSLNQGMDVFQYIYDLWGSALDILCKEVCLNKKGVS